MRKQYFIRQLSKPTTRKNHIFPTSKINRIAPSSTQNTPQNLKSAPFVLHNNFPKNSLIVNYKLLSFSYPLYCYCTDRISMSLSLNIHLLVSFTHVFYVHCYFKSQYFRDFTECIYRGIAFSGFDAFDDSHT